MSSQIEQWSLIFCVIIPVLSYTLLSLLSWADASANGTQQIHIFCSRLNHRAQCTCETGDDATRAAAHQWGAGLPKMDRGGWVSSRHGLYTFMKEGV